MPCMHPTHFPFACCCPKPTRHPPPRPHQYTDSWTFIGPAPSFTFTLNVPLNSCGKPRRGGVVGAWDVEGRHLLCTEVLAHLVPTPGGRFLPRGSRPSFWTHLWVCPHHLLAGTMQCLDDCSRGVEIDLHLRRQVTEAGCLQGPVPGALACRASGPCGKTAWQAPGLLSGTHLELLPPFVSGTPDPGLPTPAHPP